MRTSDENASHRNPRGTKKTKWAAGRTAEVPYTRTQGEVVKTEDSIRTSMHARFEQMKRATTDLHRCVSGTQFPETISSERTARIRQLADEIGQCFHEFTAYRNCLVTE